MKRRTSLLLLAAALLGLPRPAASSSASQQVAADEASGEQPAEDLEDLTAERDDLKAQLATKNQEFLAQHSRADRLAVKVASLKRLLAAEVQKEQALQWKLNQVRSLVDVDAAAPVAVPTEPGSDGDDASLQAAAAGVLVDDNSTPAFQHGEAHAASASAARPPSQAAAGNASAPARRPARARQGSQASAKAVAHPMSLPAGGAAHRRQAKSISAHGATASASRSGQPASSKGRVARGATALPPKAATEARQAHVRSDHAEQRPRPQPAQDKTARVARAKPAKSRATLMSELKMQVSHMSTNAGQVDDGSSTGSEGNERLGPPSPGEAGGASVPEARKAPLQSKAPALVEQSTEENSTAGLTAGADFDELETQLHEEDRRIDELDRESQDDNSQAENASLGDASSSKVDSLSSDVGGDGSSAADSDDSEFFSQLSKV